MNANRDIQSLIEENPALALWQFVVRENLLQVRRVSFIVDPQHPVVLNQLPEMVAANQMIQLFLSAGAPPPLIPVAEKLERNQDEIYFMGIAFVLALARINGNSNLITGLEEELQKYTNENWKYFLQQCIEDYVLYYTKYVGENKQ